MIGLVAAYCLLLAGFAAVLAVVIIRDRLELHHHYELCTGEWLPWPSVEHEWLVRCDRCGRLTIATRRVREQRIRDLELAQTIRFLELSGRELLEAERERAS